MLQQVKEFFDARKTKDALDRLGQRLKRDFDEAERLRRPKEEEWIESIRQCKGIYDPEVEAKIQAGKSKIYPKYTRSKEVPCVAKLNNLLFPGNDKNWEITPTPKPDIPQDKIAEIAMSLVKQDEVGNAVMPAPEQVDAAINAYVKIACQNMSVEMDDQLTEMKYREKAKRQIKSAVRYGTGILKGPLSEGKTITTLGYNTETGGYIKKKQKEYHPFIDNVPIWRFFPDMSTTEFDECNHVFEITPKTKHELRALAENPEFDATVINDYIKTHPEGNYKLRDWEIDIRTVAKEDTPKKTNKYEVFEYSGYIDSQIVFEAGVIEEDMESDIFMHIWLLENKVIRADVYPSYNVSGQEIAPTLKDIYHLFYFEKDESSIFGTGLPVIIRQTQIAICAGTRAMLDNAGMVAGPILEINTDLIDDDDPANVHPGRKYLRTGQGMDAQYPAIRAYNIDSRISDYLAMLGKFEQNGDMESGLPAFLFGGKTTNETAKGVSIRESSLNIVVDDIVKNFDSSNESVLRALYKWNMDPELNLKESIKGDFNIKATGSSSLVSKEVRTQALDFFAQTLSSEERMYIRLKKFVEKRLKLHDLDAEDLLKTDEEYGQDMAARRDAEAEILSKQALAAKTDYDQAKAESMRAKAKAVLHKAGLQEDETLMNAIDMLIRWRGGNAGQEDNRAGA